jgi:hypothetical protein
MMSLAVGRLGTIVTAAARWFLEIFSAGFSCPFVLTVLPVVSRAKLEISKGGPPWYQLAVP